MERAIRPFEENDTDAVVDIWHRAGVTAYTYIPTWQVFTREHAARVFADVVAPHSDLWVGLENGTIVAYLAMQESYIARLYVDPSRWRRGWGNALVEFAKSLRPDGLELHTHVGNAAARALYERHGFKAVKFGMSPQPENVPDVEYHWRPE